MPIKTEIESLYSDPLFFCRRHTQTHTDSHPKTDIRHIRKKYAVKTKIESLYINFISAAG